jgi:hypothetical protein
MQDLGHGQEDVRISGMTHVRTSPFYPQSAAHRGGCAPLDSELRGSLQHGASAQRDRVCDTAGYAGGAVADRPVLVQVKRPL